jgi:amino-acid N-acetyltransferase
MTATVRQARAGDVGEILSILEPYIQQGIVLKRTYEEIASHIGSFLVAESGDTLLGVVAHYSYSRHLKEVRSLAVRQSAVKQGIGKLLVKEKIRTLLEESPHAKIFTLTYVPGFFGRLDFHTVDKNCFPEKIWKDCSKCTKAESCGETALVYGEAVSVTPLD